jgi:signal transduction histidine kinase
MPVNESDQKIPAASERPAVWGFLVGVALLAGAGAADWSTGPELASAIFYLPAIIWLTWKGGRSAGFATALISGVIWLLIAMAARPNYGYTWIANWNALVRTITFCLVSGLQSEIIQRKRTERRLEQTNAEKRRQAEILASILNSMRDGVVVVGQEGKFIHVNPAAQRLLHIDNPADASREALRSASDADAAGAPGPKSAESPLLRAARGQNVDEAEVFFRAPGKPEGAWLAVTGRPLRTGGGVTGGVIVFADISARKRLEWQIAEASNREQRRLGEDLHDGLCQHLVSTAFAARGLAGSLSRQNLPEAAQAAKVAELISGSIKQARDVARGLSLVPVETGGLMAALEELALRIHSQHGVACEFQGPAESTEFAATVATNLFRIAQEATTNAVKHGQASRISIHLVDEPAQIRLEVADNGGGLPPGANTGPGMGLHLMDYRARMVGGVLHVGSRESGGTLVSCVIPRASLSPSPATTYADTP